MGMSNNVLLSTAEKSKDLHNTKSMEELKTLDVKIVVVEEEETTVKKATLGGLDAVADEDDDEEGFKTPPLPQHSIRALKECPPAPRKTRDVDFTTPRPPWKKRKLEVMSPTPRRPVQLLDYSNEVEAMFPLAMRRNFYGKLRKVGEDNGNLWLQK